MRFSGLFFSVVFLLYFCFFSAFFLFFFCFFSAFFCFFSAFFLLFFCFFHKRKSRKCKKETQNELQTLTWKKNNDTKSSSWWLKNPHYRDLNIPSPSCWYARCISRNCRRLDAPYLPVALLLPFAYPSLKKQKKAEKAEKAEKSRKKQKEAEKTSPTDKKQKKTLWRATQPTRLGKSKVYYIGCCAVV